MYLFTYFHHVSHEMMKVCANTLLGSSDSDAVEADFGKRLASRMPWQRGMSVASRKSQKACCSKSRNPSLQLDISRLHIESYQSYLIAKIKQTHAACTPQNELLGRWREQSNRAGAFTT